MEVGSETSTPRVEGDQAYLVFWAYLDLFRLIQTLLSSFGFIWAHLSSFELMLHWKNFIYIEPHLEDAYLHEERELRLINLKAIQGELGFHPHT